MFNCRSLNVGMQLNYSLKDIVFGLLNYTLELEDIVCIIIRLEVMDDWKKKLRGVCDSPEIYREILISLRRVDKLSNLMILQCFHSFRFIFLVYLLGTWNFLKFDKCSQMVICLCRSSSLHKERIQTRDWTSHGRLDGCYITGWSCSNHNLCRGHIWLVWSSFHVDNLLTFVLYQWLGDVVVFQCIYSPLRQTLGRFRHRFGHYHCSHIHCWNSSIWCEGIVEYHPSVRWVWWIVLGLLHGVWNVLDGKPKLEIDAGSFGNPISCILCPNCVLLAGVTALAGEQRKNHGG